MKFRLLVKVSVLVVLLGMTLYAISTLKSGGLAPSLQQALMVQNTQTTATPESPTGPSEVNVILCPTRVSAVEQRGLFRMEQNGMRWVLAGAIGSTLNQVAVEKWFGRYCTFRAMSTGGSKTSSMQPVIYFEYVDGTSEPLLVSPTGVFAWKDYVFQSQALVKGLQELRELAGVGSSAAPRSNSEEEAP